MRITKRVLLTLILCFIGMNPIRAYYNGEGVDVGGGTLHGSCPASSLYCGFNNDKHKTVRVGVWYYYPNHTYELVGHPIYLTSNVGGVSVLGIDTSNFYSVPGLSYSNARSIVETNRADYLVKMGIDINTLTKDSIEVVEGVHNLNTYGYRIFVEPVLTVYRYINGKGQYSVATVKNIANVGTTCNGNFYGVSCGDSGTKYWGIDFTTDLDDVGITHAASKGDSVPTKVQLLKNLSINKFGDDSAAHIVSTVADYYNGFGYNIIDITKDIPRCYKINKISLPAVCANVGKYNIGIFTEYAEKVTCSSSHDEGATENGRLTYTGNGCKVYCLESAQQIFPGSVSQRASIGGYLVWPTGADIHEINYNQYSLSFFGKKKCTIEGNVSACQNVSIDQLNYKFDTDITVKWQDGSSNKYKTATLKKGKVNYNKTVNDNQIIVTASVRYTLNSQFNRYINIKDGSFTSTKPEKNYIDIGYGNLPISSKAKMSEKYYLTIETNKLGGNSGSTFANVASNSNVYKCYYKVGPPSSCKCPDDSKYPGKDLMEYLSNMTCSDAQLKYCSTPGPTPTPENCLICPAGTIREGMEMKNIELCNNPDDIKEEDLCDEIIDNKYYCPAPNEDVNITSCLKAGGTIEKCKNQLCPNNPDDLHCPNTNGVNDDSMDARLVDCVKTKVGQGVSYKEAVAICEQQVCPLKGGLNIIYRVIDLDNPFPGKEFNGNVKGFNDASKGRYPGQNWNSKDLVKSKIRNNRSVDGDSVYSKTPLYKFELTSANIKAIRKYNKTNKYDDFKLDCKLNNSAACVSNFVHNSALSGLTSGTCSGKMTSSNFYTCNN